MTTTKQIAVAAVLLSVSVHIAFAAIWSNPEPVALQGGAVSGQVSLGNGFADLVQGVISGSPEFSEKTAAAAPPVAQAVRPAPAQVLQPTAKLTQPAQVQSQPADARAVLPVQAQAVPTAKAVSAATPSQVADRLVVQDVVAARAAPNVTASSEPSPDPAVQALQAFKPKPRPDRPPTPVVKPAPRGNANVNAATGRADGVAKTKVAESNNAAETKAKQAGETELRSYQSNVRRRVARTKTRAAGGSGSVRLSLQISAGGALVGTQIVKSSGNARADKAALETVRRAAPFGPTPTQKAVVFQIQIDVKG